MSSASRRLLILNHAKSSVRSINPRLHNYVSCLSSIPHKNQAPEDLSPIYKTVEGDANATNGIRSAGATPSVEKDLRRELDINMDGPPRKTPADMAKEGAVGAMETGLKLGKMAKQTLDGVLEVAEKTTEKVRDSVDDEDTDDVGRRRVQDPIVGSDNRSSDKFVEDLKRTSAGGFDSKYRR